jgi:hypothetical protein
VFFNSEAAKLERTRFVSRPQPATWAEICSSFSHGKYRLNSKIHTTTCASHIHRNSTLLSPCYPTLQSRLKTVVIEITGHSVVFGKENETWWDFRSSQRREWRWLSPGILHCVVWYKFVDVSEVLTAFTDGAINQRPHDGGSSHLSNVGKLLSDYMGQNPLRHVIFKKNMIPDLTFAACKR